MINIKYILLLVIVVLTIAWACTPESTERKAAQGITESLSNNNIAGAKEYANTLNNSEGDFSKLPVVDLCSLSVSLMKLSQSSTDGNDFAAQALKYYEAALAKDSVSTNNYFELLGPEDYHYIHLLRQLSNQMKVRESGVYQSDVDYEF